MAHSRKEEIVQLKLHHHSKSSRSGSALNKIIFPALGDTEPIVCVLGMELLTQDLSYFFFFHQFFCPACIKWQRLGHAKCSLITKRTCIMHTGGKYRFCREKKKMDGGK